jgi:hypothetical protein
VGATTPEEFHNEYFGLRSYGGYVLDTTHAKNEQGSGRGVISDIDRSMPVLAPHVRAIHWSLNRTDLGGDAAKESREDAFNVLNGRIVGKTAMMLDALKDEGAQVDYAVVEWTIPDVVDALQERHPHTTPTQEHINWAYGQAATTLAQYMGRDRVQPAPLTQPTA